MTPPNPLKVHRILTNVVGVTDSAVHFMDEDGCTRIGPWLILDTLQDVETLLRKGNITDDDLAEFQRDMRAWGQTSTHIHLDADAYAKLVAEGIKRPWNGYEERKRRAQRHGMP